ncbi:MAG: penicillin-binding protein [Micromonosporaceae bacterium]|nr:penicillin-binding protein [Micromonosporaceae bacterium]
MRRRGAYLLAGLVAAAVTLVGCSGDGGPGGTLEAFLKGWRSGDLHQVGFVTPDGDRVPASDVAAEIKSLSGELGKNPPKLTVSKDPEESEGQATAEVTVDWTLPGDVHWTYPTTVRLTKVEKGWQVVWQPAVVQKDLTRGDVLAVRRLPAQRGSILDGSGEAIVKPRKVVRVGVEKQLVKDLTKLIKDLDAAFKSIRGSIGEIDLSDLPARVEAATPAAFVDVVTLREEDYLKIRSRIRPLDGTKFITDELPLAPTRVFARGLLGTVGDVTREDMDNNPGKFVVGDQIGHGGLQGKYDERLRGTPGRVVVIERKAPDGSVNDTEVFRSDPKPGTPVKTTLDQRVQRAADSALVGQKNKSSLVAIRISDGAVLAAANGPNGGDGSNLAFTAAVPPGSTFKVVTALSLLDAGKVDLNTIVDCPRTFAVPGRPPVKNSDFFELGKVPFRTDFAKSCNTAFASLAPQLGPTGLADTGATLGLGADWDLGIDAFSGKVSSGGSEAERAAAAFGQGTTLVSPLAMASVTAAVARGQFKQPRVLLDPAPAKPAPDGPKLKAESVDQLRTMMREVVTKGSGAALKDVPGDPVYGKTGTAEFDNNPAHTHAWFIGYQGDIAFAVFVENGGGGSAVAVPIAEKFLRLLKG